MWETKKLGEVCDVRRGTTITKKTAIPGDVPVIAGGLQAAYFHNEANRPSETITVSGSGANAGFVNFHQEPIFASDCSTIIPKDEMLFERRFLYLFMLSMQKYINENLRCGAAQPHVYPRDLAELKIPIIPLPEQKRIVALLDEAFAGIDQAIKNTEKAKAAAQEMFDSSLNAIFTQRGNGWVEKKLGDVCENFDKKRIPITKNRRTSGDIPYYGASGIVDYVEGYLFDEDLLLVSEDGANLLMRTYPIAFSVSGKTWVNNHAHVLKFEEKNSQIFVEYYLNSISLERYVSGMAQPKLNQRSLSGISILWPPLNQQAQIVEKLDTLASQCDELVEKYAQKLAHLQELKQSLLQQAFAGKLTIEKPKIKAKAIDLHAAIISFAYHKHEQAKRTETYGHVKAEKITHLAECISGIDLDRTPRKEAAGPYDNHSFKYVLEHARHNGYFKFDRRSIVLGGYRQGGYQLEKGPNFNDAIELFKTALHEQKSAIEELIDFIVPMNTEQAEIFTTIYAGWNNLLLDGKQPTDEEIVTESREQWHVNKKKIDRDKFFKAIQWMRQKNIVPHGQGKKVEA